MELIMFKKIDVLLLAGGKTKISLRRFTGKENKSFIEIGPRHIPMILYIIESFKKAKYIDKIIVAGSIEVQNLIKNLVYLTVPEGPTILDTVKSGISPLKEKSFIMISTSDIPLVTEKHIDNFVEKCIKKPGFDIYYPIVSKEKYLKTYPSPDLKRTYANFVNGSFTGGNFLMINPKIIREYSDVIENFIHFRKHPLKMARLLGAQITSKYLRGYLSIQDLEKRIPELLGGYRGRAIPSPPQIALDIDKPRHLKILWENFK
ncbi:MAG: NTP transferase domain-containing protein [Candidatus Caldatribacteriota bacterium]|nr:NTP transferase domain-containing protein [Candidatus Caldatribacteriota bacterium]